LIDISTFSDTFVNMKADPAATAPVIAMMDIIDFARALEHARRHALPGREAATRDAMLCELRRRLFEAHEREPRPCDAHAPIRLRLLVRD
jgi:hypothetical protein